MKIYDYLFYRIADFWIKTDKTKDMNPFYDEKHGYELDSAVSILSVIQFSNLNAILIIPLKLLGIYLTHRFVIITGVIIVVYNLFICNLYHKYLIAEERWKSETKKQRKINAFLLIIFVIISITLLFVAYKTIYK